ncbi:hypothetical protein K438DRAFT_1706847 [Mycena galopus ATCC 62051]|nr:hypothetical protein K438DRAFT_1706847 [Mycena galopus ATCC 62051]
MPSPPIEVFLTTIASQVTIRSRQEFILRTLQVKKIPFTSYDLASDENAKRLWRRKAPADKQQLPGILVGGRFVGPFQDFEDAVEYGELDTFLRLKESWNPDVDGEGTPLVAKLIGVPGAQTPLEMTPEHIRKEIIAQQSSPLRGKGGVPVNKRTDMFDAGTAFSGFGLQGVQVSESELADLVAELGLEGDEAGDLVKGLSSASPVTPPLKEKEPKPVSPAKEVTPEVKPTEEVVKPAEEVDSAVKPTEEVTSEVKAAEEIAAEVKPSEEVATEVKPTEEVAAEVKAVAPKVADPTEVQSEPAAPVQTSPKIESQSQPNASKD